MTKSYKIIPATVPFVPIIIGAPHVGTAFPAEVKDAFHSYLLDKPDDTDWFVHQLYDFAPALGITIIHAVYSRWVVDLNRDPASKPLYNDGRIITGLCPSTNFFGEELYKSSRPDQKEIDRRVDLYYTPYYTAIQELIDERKEQFGKVLFFDAHSIRKRVETIRKEDFPDLILGDNDEQTADKRLITSVLQSLKNEAYQLSHNTPFKGGMITRHFGKPLEGQHTLQLEMAKINYMDDTETYYHEERANKMRIVLKAMFADLIKEMNNI